MLQTCRAITRVERARRNSRFGFGALQLLCAALGCDPQNGVVGTEPSYQGAAPDPVPPLRLTFRSDFDKNGGQWQPTSLVPGGSTNFGVTSPDADDLNTVELLYPGHVSTSGSAADRADYETEIASSQRFSFGTFRTRLSFGQCDPSEDLIHAAIGYFNDGGDANRNGITDDSEINLQVLCGTPQYLFLTVFTDYQTDSTGAEQFRMLSRVIDFSNGQVFDTPSAESRAYSMTATEAAFVQPGLFTAGVFYEVGFEWHASSVRFFMQLNGRERTLWTLSDSARIPTQPLKFVYNLRHPDAHWYPATGSASFPANDVLMHVDWFEYYAE